MVSDTLSTGELRGNENVIKLPYESEAACHRTKTYQLWQSGHIILLQEIFLYKFK